MVELSSLLFKPVIERDTSNVVGRIKNAYFSQGCTTIAYCVVSSCKQGCDALLPIADVLCFSDAIVVQNDANVRCIDDVDFTLFSNGIIGMEVYTQNGILKGKIQKVEFTVRIPLFSTKFSICEKYVLYEKNRGYPPSCPQFRGKMWITLWKRWYFYTCMNMFSFVTICVSNLVGKRG